MKYIEREVTISFNWRREDGKDIRPGHIEQLEEHALARAQEMSADGYVEGELSAYVNGIKYIGWWEVKKP